MKTGRMQEENLLSLKRQSRRETLMVSGQG
jgi:hypothetical protein